MTNQEFKPILATKEGKENPILSHFLATCSTFSKVRQTLAYVNQFIGREEPSPLKNFGMLRNNFFSELSVT